MLGYRYIFLFFIFCQIVFVLFFLLFCLEGIVQRFSFFKMCVQFLKSDVFVVVFEEGKCFFEVFFCYVGMVGVCFYFDMYFSFVIQFFGFF